MPIQNITPATSDEIKDDFLSCFEPTDNFKLDQEGMYQAVSEAMVSLLIRNKLSSKDFLQYFSGSIEPNGDSVFYLSKKDKYGYCGEVQDDNATRNTVCMGETVKLPIKHKGKHVFEIGCLYVTSVEAKNLEKNFAARMSLQTSSSVFPQPYPRSIYRIEPDVSWPNHPFLTQETSDYVSMQTLVPTSVEDVMRVRDWFHYKYTNLYNLFEHEIKEAKKRTPEYLWQKMAGEPFDFGTIVKKALLGTNPVDFEYGKECWWEKWAEKNTNWQECSELDRIEYLLERITEARLFPDRFPALCKDFLIEFKNHYHEIESGVYVSYDFEKHKKTLIPVTTFPVEYSASKFVATVPPPDKKLQLFNLDKICTDTPKNILITDSLQIAALNSDWLEQRGWIITSALCFDKYTDAIDWEPLSRKDYVIQGIYYLITNHSGFSLRDAYQRAYDFQHNGNDGEYISRFPNLKYIQFEVRYPAYLNLDSLNAFLIFDADNKPQRIESSVMVLDETKFIEIYNRASVPEKPFWETPDVVATKPIKESSSSKKPIPYLLRPVLRHGQITMLYSPKGNGKSLLALCMSMAVVGASQESYQVFKEMQWRTIPHVENKKYIPRKILYLAFEQPERVIERFNEKKKIIWKSRVEECESNFILKTNMPKKNYLAKENQRELLELFDKAKDEGIPRLPVDLVVIDTLTSCVTFSNLTEIGNRITELREEIQKRNLAMLIIHHSNAEENVRGGEDILKSVDLTIYMGNSLGDGLSDTEKADIHKARPISRKNGNEQNDWIKDEFHGFFKDEDETWHVDCDNIPADTFEAKMLTDVVAHYRKRGFTLETIAKMLGTSDNTLRKKWYEAHSLLKGNNVKQ